MTINLSTKQKLFAFLCCAHLIGASLAVLWATFWIESIIPSGIILGPLGMITSVLIRWGAPRMLGLLGLSVIALSVSVFALINIQDWSPANAEWPVAIILLAYHTATLPLGLLALRDILFKARGYPFAMRHQFSLRTLLLMMAAVSLVLAVIKIGLNCGAPPLLATATGLCVATLLGITSTWWSVMKGPRPLAEAEPTAAELPVVPGR